MEVFSYYEEGLNLPQEYCLDGLWKGKVDYVIRQVSCQDTEKIMELERDSDSMNFFSSWKAVCRSQQKNMGTESYLL